MGSRASQRPKVGKTSYVDESLFGGAKKPGTGAPGARGTVSTSAGVITLDELRTIRGKTVKNNQNDAVVIDRKDLERIKEATTIKTK